MSELSTDEMLRVLLLSLDELKKKQTEISYQLLTLQNDIQEIKKNMEKPSYSSSFSPSSHYFRMHENPVSQMNYGRGRGFGIDFKPHNPITIPSQVSSTLLCPKNHREIEDDDSPSDCATDSNSDCESLNVEMFRYQ